MRLIAYLRVSTDEQARNGLSLDAQREKIEHYCASQERHELVAVYEDPGVSGTVPPGERPGLSAALACLLSKQPTADGLIVWKLDRFTRRLSDLLDAAKEFKRYRRDLVSVSEQIDTSSAVGKMMFAMLGAFAEFERDQISDRTRSGLDQVRKQGREAGRWTPWGWRTADGSYTVKPGDKRAFVEHEGEQLLIEWMRRKRAEGASFAEIATSMMLAGMDNPRTDHKLWTGPRIRKILASAERRVAV